VQQRGVDDVAQREYSHSNATPDLYRKTNSMLEIAIDIGGTFTDVMGLYDQQLLWLAKVPTTPRDLVQGVRQGVARVLQLAG
jgi:hypothetical protein